MGLLTRLVASRRDRELKYQCSACSEIFGFDPESEDEASDGPRCPTCSDRNVSPI